jgi:hypothetical protein
LWSEPHPTASCRNGGWESSGSFSVRSSRQRIAPQRARPSNEERGPHKGLSSCILIEPKPWCGDKGRSLLCRLLCNNLLGRNCLCRDSLLHSLTRLPPLNPSLLKSSRDPRSASRTQPAFLGSSYLRCRRNCLGSSRPSSWQVNQNPTAELWACCNFDISRSICATSSLRSSTADRDSALPAREQHLRQALAHDHHAFRAIPASLKSSPSKIGRPSVSKYAGDTDWNLALQSSNPMTAYSNTIRCPGQRSERMTGKREVIWGARPIL